MALWTATGKVIHQASWSHTDPWQVMSLCMSQQPYEHALHCLHTLRIHKSLLLHGTTELQKARVGSNDLNSK